MNIHKYFSNAALNIHNANVWFIHSSLGEKVVVFVIAGILIWIIYYMITRK